MEDFEIGTPLKFGYDSRHHDGFKLYVNDELVFETPESEVESMAEIVQSEMIGAMTLNVPLKVDLSWGANWYEAK